MKFSQKNCIPRKLMAEKLAVLVDGKNIMDTSAAVHTHEQTPLFDLDT